MKKSEYGFTNDDADYEAVRAFRAAAVADEWSSEPTYGDGESEERASKHTKDGFVMQVLARTLKPGSKWKFQAQVLIWGPDRLAIDVPDAYDWNVIQARVRHCNVCGADDVPTARYFFAGRACLPCLPAAKAYTEVGNWTE